MGKRPSTKYSIDRIDNDGNYEPNNCRWVTMKEQANNRTNNVHSEYQYLNALKDVLESGERVPNRTGTDTLRIFDVNMKFDLSKSLPLLTTKKVWFKGVAIELLWFLSGSTNIKYLVDNGVNIWNGDAHKHYLRQQKKSRKGISGGAAVQPLDEANFIKCVKEGSLPGELGPVYGKQWRQWEEANPKGSWEDVPIVGRTHDQIAKLIHNLKTNPSSRRHILTAWNVADIDKMGLPPCHLMSMFSVTTDNKLNCKTIIRSNDAFLGCPFNIASYALLTHMLAQVCGLQPGMLYYNAWDFHIYVNHLDAVKEQLTREPKKFPELVLTQYIDNIDDFKYDDIKVEGYESHKRIKAELNT